MVEWIDPPLAVEILWWISYTSSGRTPVLDFLRNQIVLTNAPCARRTQVEIFCGINLAILVLSVHA